MVDQRIETIRISQDEPSEKGVLLSASRVRENSPASPDSLLTQSLLIVQLSPRELDGPKRPEPLFQFLQDAFGTRKITPTNSTTGELDGDPQVFGVQQSHRIKELFRCGPLTRRIQCDGVGHFGDGVIWKHAENLVGGRVDLRPVTVTEGIEHRSPNRPGE